jgi:hypothetical protein
MTTTDRYILDPDAGPKKGAMVDFIRSVGDPGGHRTGRCCNVEWIEFFDENSMVIKRYGFDESDNTPTYERHSVEVITQITESPDPDLLEQIPERYWKR